MSAFQSRLDPLRPSPTASASPRATQIKISVRLSSTHISVTPAQPFCGRGKKRKAHPASHRRRDLHRARLHRYGSLRPTAASSHSPRSPGQPALRRPVPAPAAQPLPLARSTLRLPPAGQLLGGQELVLFLSLHFLPHLLSLVQILLDPLLIHLCKVLCVI